MVRTSLFLDEDVEDKSPKSRRNRYQFIRLGAKHILDFVLALIGLIFLSPFFIIIGFIIRQDSPGGIFYWSPRIGYRGKLFKMLKFRTMYETPESYAGLRITCRGDARITPFGCWLRDTKVNELPQLWNVLKGEMSLVGPRPEDPEIAREWPEDASQEILSVRPGITSPASILYHDEESHLNSNDVMGSYYNDILPDKMRLDRLYVRHQGFFTDIDILFWTIVVIIPLLVRTPIPEGYLFAGPISRLFNRHVTWLIIDLLTSLISLAGVSLIWRSQLPINWGFENFILLSFCLAFLFSGVNFITGLNRIDWPRATIQDAIALGLSGACVTFVILVLDVVQMYLQIIPLPALPIPMIVTIGMVAFGGFFITRFRWRILTTIASRWIIWRRNRSGVGERIVIVGSGEGCQTATWLLNRERYLYAFSVVGIVDDDVLPKKDMRIDGYKILGRFNDLPNLVAKYDVGLIIFTTPSIPPEINEFVHDLAKAGTVRLIYLEKLIKFVDQQLMSKDILLSHHLGPEENLEFLATHSELTGLPNSYLFKYQLRHSIAYSKRYQNNLAVLLINLEGYEDIVKSHGRNYGKEILKETARRLIRCKRESDLLACLRESKFALILENVQDCDTVDVVIHRINDILNEPVKVDGQVFNLSTSTKSFVGVKSCEESRLIEDFYIESN